MTVKRMRLCYWIAWPAKSSAFHCHFAQTHAFLLLSHILCINGIEMALVWLILIYFEVTYTCISNSQFHCIDESWWNMPFKETRLGDGVADNAVAMLISLWLLEAALRRHAVWIRILTSSNKPLPEPIYWPRSMLPHGVARPEWVNNLCCHGNKWGLVFIMFEC